jgi:MFS family permease
MTDSQTTVLTNPDDVPLKTQLAVYGIGTFSTTTHFMLMVIVPIWARVNMGIPEGFTLGLVLGCRPLLSLFLSIHAGSLMDKLGTKRVMFFIGLMILFTPFMYPLLPFVSALIVIQLLSGVCDSIGWMGAQTLVGQVMHGRTKYAARLGAIIRSGHVIGPPAVGAVWDFAGPMAAFSLVGLSGVGFMVSVMMLPAISARPAGTAAYTAETPRAPFVWKSLLPNPADYIASFKLLASPTIAIVILLGMMVHIGNNIQSTFYIVWLEKYVGVPATLIGFLISFSSIAAAGGSLAATPLRRRFPAFWVLWAAIFTALIFISITPLLGKVAVVAGVTGILGWAIEISPLIAAYLVFCFVAGLRSVSNGIHQPLVITLMLRTVGPNEKGKAIGLRGTMNRVTSMLGPFLLGGLAGMVGLEYGFYIIGIMSSMIMLWLAWLMLRHPEIHDLQDRVKEEQ